MCVRWDNNTNQISNHSQNVSVNHGHNKTHDHPKSQYKHTKDHIYYKQRLKKHIENNSTTAECIETLQNAKKANIPLDKITFNTNHSSNNNILHHVIESYQSMNPKDFDTLRKLLCEDKCSTTEREKLLLGPKLNNNLITMS